MGLVIEILGIGTGSVVMEDRTRVLFSRCVQNSTDLAEAMVTVVELASHLYSLYKIVVTRNA
jgi:hypothetical protein